MRKHNTGQERRTEMERKRKRLTTGIATGVLLLLLAFTIRMVTACSSIDCDIEGRVMCHYKIEDSEGNGGTLNYPLSISFHRKTANGDTVFINRMTNVADFDLPMSYGADTDELSMTLHLTDSTEIYDVIWITKTNVPQFESVDCAPRYKHTIQGVRSTHNFIDTVIINNPKVSNDASASNIHIRLRNSNG